MKISTLFAATVASLALAGTAYADSPNTAPNTPATDIHGAPGNTPGFGGNSANPNGVGDGGGGIHNISGGAPGQNGEVNPGELGGHGNRMIFL